MDGIIQVIKPPGLSSQQVVSHIKRCLGIKKAGHTGTLDPGASGLLVVCVGKATRAIPFFVERRKTYVAEMTLGLSTKTQDGAGQTETICEDQQIDVSHLVDVLAQFVGTIQQVPPMASALRVGGKRLYELERAGKEVERQPRQAIIYRMSINRILPEDSMLGFGAQVLLQTCVSKGTYIRTLCHDIGQALGLGAHMSFLTRTESGPFALEQGCTLEEITEAASRGDYSFLSPIDAGFPHWPRVKAAPGFEERIIHGNTIPVETLVAVSQDLVVGDDVLVYSLEGALLALGRIKQEQNVLFCSPVRVLKEGGT